MISSLSSIYSSQTGLIGQSCGSGLSSNGATPASRQEFSDILSQFSSQVSDTLRAGETAAIGGVLGTTNVQQSVEGVMAAEQALQLGIGVRDKIVNAYVELSRMAI